MRAHVPRGAVTAMEGPRLRVASGLGKVGRTLLSPHPESRGGMETPRGLGPHQVAWEGPGRRKNQFQPERPAQAIDTSVPGRVKPRPAA